VSPNYSITIKNVINGRPLSKHNIKDVTNRVVVIKKRLRNTTLYYVLRQKEKSTGAKAAHNGEIDPWLYSSKVIEIKN
jgi:hypothetical protein